MEMEYTSKGQGALNTVLGAIGTAGAVGLLNGGGCGGGMLGGLFGNGNGNGCCSDDRCVNRYELGLIQSNTDLKTENALLKADKYTDQKFADFADRMNDRFRNVEQQLAIQAVHNQKVEGSFALVAADLEAAKKELGGRIAMEAERRCCADNAMVNYMNATFYPKQVADVTVGTTSVAQAVYNPIPKCQGGCGCGC